MFRMTLFAMALIVSTTSAMAGAPMNPEKVRETIAANLLRLSPQLVVKDVRPLDIIPGLYEVQVGDTIFYTDATGDHMISGHMFDTATRSDLTQARLETLNRIDWSTLPLENAIVSGDAKATKKVAVFTDPDCPFCRHLEKEMPNVKGVKVYTFLMPLESIHKHARGKAEAIWCSTDRHKAMQDVMLGNKLAADLKAKPCKTPIDANIALAESLGISGTPTLIAGDGRKRAGGMSASQLEQWLAQ